MKTALFGIVLLVVVTSIALADTVHFEPSDVRTVFLVSKNENRNQVHYGIRLDAHCEPRGATPVFAYWRNLESGPADLSPLLPIELRAYGIAEQRIDRRGALVAVDIRLAALSERVVRIEVSQANGRCRARAFTSIGGQQARLHRVHVILGLFRPESIQLMGQGTRRGDVAEETLSY